MNVRPHSLFRIDFKTKALVKPVVVSPDAGGVARAKMFREGLEASGMRASLAMIIPRTAHEHGADDDENLARVTDLVGHVSGCDCIIVDDMIDTAGMALERKQRTPLLRAC